MEAKEKIFRASWDGEIKEIKVIRKNEKSFWTWNDHRDKEERSARHNNYSSYFDTMDEAKNHLEKMPCL